MTANPSEVYLSESQLSELISGSNSFDTLSSLTLVCHNKQKCLTLKADSATLHTGAHCVCLQLLHMCQAEKETGGGKPPEVDGGGGDGDEEVLFVLRW